MATSVPGHHTGKLLLSFRPFGISFLLEQVPLNVSFPFFPRRFDVYENGIDAAALAQRTWVPRTDIDTLYRLSVGRVKVKWFNGPWLSSVMAQDPHIDKVAAALTAAGYPLQKG